MGGFSRFLFHQFLFSILVTLFLGAGFSYAADLRSDNFIVRDPLVNGGATYGSSTTFQLFSSGALNAIGTSSATSFLTRLGFLYFPFAETPVVAATAGDAQVSLSWSAVAGSLGYRIASHEVGQSTVSGGPYIYTNVGSTTSSTRTGLTNGTTYYFVVRSIDGVGTAVSTSTQVSATPTGGAAPPPAGGGGGGGGGGGASSPASVSFLGRAFPESRITLLKDAQIAVTTVSGPDAKFSIALTGLSSGNYIFSIYGEDQNGRRSATVNFPVGVTAGSQTTISGIFLAPTIALDKAEVRRGDNLAIFGQTTPTGEVTILVNSEQEIFARAKADPDGIYLYNLDTTPLEIGSHLARSKVATGNEISPFSNSAGFLVGTRNVGIAEIKKCPLKGDINDDCRVNLIDFSIAAFWYQRIISMNFLTVERAKLSSDGKVDLVDFSILAYYWTG